MGAHANLYLLLDTSSNGLHDLLVVVCLDKQTFFSVKVRIFSYPSVLAYVFSAQKNGLNEMVLMSTHNICFG